MPKFLHTANCACAAGAECCASRLLPSAGLEGRVEFDLTGWVLESHPAGRDVVCARIRKSIQLHHLIKASAAHRSLRRFLRMARAGSNDTPFTQNRYDLKVVFQSPPNHAEGCRKIKSETPPCPPAQRCQGSERNQANRGHQGRQPNTGASNERLHRIRNRGALVGICA